MQFFKVLTYEIDVDKWFAHTYDDQTEQWSKEEVGSDQVGDKLAELKTAFPDPDNGWQNERVGWEYKFTRAAIPS